MLKIIGSTEAKIDLKAKLYYLKEHFGDQAAATFFSKVEFTIKKAQAHPTAYRIQNQKLGIRRIRIDKHEVIYFQGKENTLRIVRICSDRQDPTGLGF